MGSMWEVLHEQWEADDEWTELRKGTATRVIICRNCGRKALGSRPQFGGVGLGCADNAAPQGAAKRCGESRKGLEHHSSIPGWNVEGQHRGSNGNGQSVFAWRWENPVELHASSRPPHAVR